MKKRILSVILSVMMLFTMCVASSAASDYAVDFVMDAPSTVSSGEQFTVSVGIDDMKNHILSGTIQLCYDPSMLEYISVSALGGNTTDFFSTINDEEAGKIVISFFSIDTCPEAFVDILTAEFRAKKTGYAKIEVLNFNDWSDKYNGSSLWFSDYDGFPVFRNNEKTVTIADYADAYSVKYVIGQPSSVEKNEQFTVSVAVDNMKNHVLTCTLEFSYDTDMLAMVSCECPGDTTDGSFYQDEANDYIYVLNKETDGSVIVAFMPVDICNSDVIDIIEFTFVAKKTGVAEIEITGEEWHDDYYGETLWLYEGGSNVPEGMERTISVTVEESSPAEFILGDVNGDSKITAADARIVLRASARLETLSANAEKNADVNNDGKVNAADARMILRVSARIDDFENPVPPSPPPVTTPPEDDTPDIKEDVVLVSGLDFGGDTGIYPDKKSVKVQSLSDFGKNELTFYGSSQDGLTLRQKFSGSKDDDAVIKEYVELLNQDLMNFTLADSHYADYGTQIFASWGFNYTGTGKVKNTCNINFIDNEEPCAISIEYTVDRNNLNGFICWSASLDMADLGFRCGNRTESVAPAGESACTGLIRTVDGKYKTTDGRFCVKPGEIQMYVDGTEEKCSFEYRARNICDYIKILDSSGSEKFRIFLSESKTPFTGEILESDDILLDGQWGDLALSGITSDMTQIYQYVNKVWLRPSYEDNPYEDLTFRTVYYNESEKIAVYYLYTYILDETELLFVVDLNNVIDETQNSSGGDSGSDVNGSGGYDQPEFSKLDCTFCDNGKCSNCNGYGTVHSTAMDSDKFGIICYKCSGTGKCFYCGGTGKR